ncbi:U-box domain-containing protein 11-like [Phoenix dactylifera]|uniref:U-box domain-containing protein 11-like n=1 Tax=Phoenix dactylifera TaxID=42345 RepID=A0A8B9A4N6_PHODC|nr:U-box domain-containing protein 11-like [Phoenix dactylifera]
MDLYLDNGCNVVRGEEGYYLGGLPFLLEAVSSGKLFSMTLAAQAIGLLGVARRVWPVVQAGAIPTYVELPREPEPLGKEIAVDVFCVLAVAEENAVLIVEELVRILQGNEEAAKSAAVDVLWDLSGYKHSISIVRESGAIPLLTELLRNGNGDLREKAAGTIAQLSNEGVNREAMVEAGAIPVLIDLLRGHSEEELREYARQVLINLQKTCFTMREFLKLLIPLHSWPYKRG